MPQTDCSHCPLRKRPLFVDFTTDELAYMTKFKTGELKVDAGTTILMEGSNSPQLFTILNGMGLRYKTLENGRRQVINFILPGDFIGLQAGIMGEMQHSVEATTRMTLCVFRREELWNLFRAQPSRAYDVTWIAATEEHFLGEAVTTLGQRTAEQRIAWALYSLNRKLRAVGLGRNGTVPLPYKQQDLADALGLSLVHTNKTLGGLRKRQLVSWSEGLLSVKDASALAQIAMVDNEELSKRPLL